MKAFFRELWKEIVQPVMVVAIYLAVCGLLAVSLRPIHLWWLIPSLFLLLLGGGFLFFRHKYERGRIIFEAVRLGIVLSILMGLIFLNISGGA